MNVMLRALNIPKIEYNSMKTPATQKEIRKKKKKELNKSLVGLWQSPVNSRINLGRLNTFNT